MNKAKGKEEWRTRKDLKCSVMEWRKNKVRVKKDKWWEVNACFLHSFLCSFLHTIPVVMWEREVKGRKWRERALHLPLFILPFLPFLTTQHLGIACQVQTHDVGSLVKGLRCNGVVLLFLFSIQLNCNALERKHEVEWSEWRETESHGKEACVTPLPLPSLPFSSFHYTQHREEIGREWNGNKQVLDSSF